MANGPSDEQTHRKYPEKVALGVVWSTRRWALTLRFGVLRFDGPIVTLHDRDDEVLFQASGTGLRVGTIGKTKISLAPGGAKTYYVAGMTAQEARRRMARELIRRHDVLTAPPRSVRVSDGQWKRMTTSTNPYTRGLDAISQRAIWQPVILGLLWSRQAQATA